MGGRGAGGGVSAGGRGGGGYRGHAHQGGRRGGQNQGQNGGAGGQVNDRNREDVKKFLTYYKRTNSICIDLYGPAFYKRKPYYDELAEFVYDILCPSDLLRAELEDVQLHPVKKHLLIKFRTQEARDTVAERLAGEGLDWPGFQTKVQGWAMDKPVMFVRILGASPHTTNEDIKNVMQQYGEIIEVKKGFLSRKLPNVTNGTWTVRLVVGVDQTLPSFVFVKDDGEIWQVVHDSQVTTCWKCGGQGHIGGRCREQAFSLDEGLVGGGQAVGGEPAPAVQTWAHVVRRGVGQQQDQLAGQDNARLAEVAREAEMMKKAANELRLAEQEDARLASDLEAERLAEQEAVRFGEEEAERLLVQELDRLSEEGAADLVQQDDELDSVVGVAGSVVAEVAAAAMEVVEGNPVVDQELFAKANVPLSVVNIMSPADTFLSPAKFAKVDSGSVITSSCEALMGSSPELPHKEAGFAKTCSSQLAGNVGEDFSQSPWGSSISPQENSGRHQDPSLEENMNC